MSRHISVLASPGPTGNRASNRLPEAKPASLAGRRATTRRSSRTGAIAARTSFGRYFAVETPADVGVVSGDETGVGAVDGGAVAAVEIAVGIGVDQSEM